MGRGERLIGKISAASLPFFNQILRKQNRECLAHRLTADVITLHQFLLGRELLCSGVHILIQDFVPQLICDFFIFDSHECSFLNKADIRLNLFGRKGGNFLPDSIV